MSVLCCQEVEKFNLLLGCQLPYTHPIIYSKCIVSGIQNTGKSNKILPLLTVCRHGLHDCVTEYMLQSGLSAIHRILVTWVLFVKAIFSCLNLKPDDGCCNLPELFNKTEHDLTDIIIARGKVQPVLHLKSIFEHNCTYISCVLEWK